MTYEDYEELADALIWHKQEKRITLERYNELLTILAKAYAAVEGIRRLNREVEIVGMYR